MPLLLLADRVVCDVHGRCFDLATADEVRVQERHLPPESASRRTWRDECQERLDVWHSNRPTLIDYAEVGEKRCLEIETSPTANEIPAAPAPAEAANIRMPPQPASAAARVARPTSATAAKPTAIRELTQPASAAALVAKPTSATAAKPTAIRELTQPASAAALVAKPASGAAVPAKPVSIRALPQAASAGVCAALDDDRAGPLRRLFVRAAPGAGLTTWLRQLAREARLRGFVPVCPLAIERWPDLLPQLRNRSVVLLADRRDPLPLRPEAGDGVARALLTLTRAGARVAVVVCRAPRRSRRPTLSLGRLPVQALARAVIGGDVTEPALQVLAGKAQGLPGSFVASLIERESVTTNLRRVAEPAARYLDMSIAIADAWNLYGRQAPVMRDIEALVARGRWAGAGRALRSQVAGQRRRGALGQAAVAAIGLARLHLSRCEIGEADRWCREAGEMAARTPDELLAAEALHWAGLIALEQADLETSDRTLRMALIAAEQQGHEALRQQIELSLGRCLFWQGGIGQMSTACDFADDEAAPPPIQAQALRLVMRRHLARGELSEAGEAIARAFGIVDTFPPHEQRDWRAALYADRARLQLAMGDPEQCGRSIEAALGTRPTPARMARIRLVRLACDQRDPTEVTRRRTARLVRIFLQARMPRLLRLRARYLIEPESRRSAELAAFIDRYGETALSGRMASALGPITASHYRTLLQMSHESGDERALLARICGFVRREVDAAYVGIYGAGRDSSAGHASHAGSGGSVGSASAGGSTCASLASAGQTRLASATIAARVIDTGQFISPAPAADALEAGAPLRAHGQAIGAIVCRWIIDSGIDRALTAQLLPAAADAAAPHAQAILDRAARIAGPSPPPNDASPARMLGVSAPMVALREKIAQAADVPFHVLIEGESGSGKELVARALHQQSVRRIRRFCAVNCAALTDDLLEAELFGHARGAFTGALTERVGLFEEAHEGTLFLDEVGELSARAQAKLLRAIQDGEIRRLGENLPRRVQPRLVAATNRRLADEAAAGRFRPDLLYRLDVIRLRVPPLRERIEDIPVLARAFWDQALARTGSRATLAPDTLAALARYDWPGNVRELQNVIARLAVQAPARGRVLPQALPPLFVSSTTAMIETTTAALTADVPGVSLARARHAFEARYVRAAIARAGGHLGRAARDLGLSRQGLNKLIARLGLASSTDVAGAASPRVDD